MNRPSKRHNKVSTDQIVHGTFFIKVLEMGTDNDRVDQLSEPTSIETASRSEVSEIATTPAERIFRSKHEYC